MSIAVYCARSWWFSTWRTTGTRPLTSPPLMAGDLDIRILERPIVYLRFHGINGVDLLFNDDQQVALTGTQVLAGRFTGSLVFLEGCFGDELSDEFLEAGAAAVVGATESTYGRRWRLGPSSKVGREWLRMIRRGKTAGAALKAAIQMVPPRFASGWRIQGDKGASLQ